MKNYFLIGAALVTLAFVASGAGGLALTASTNAQQPMDASIVQLIANPKEHNGKFVRVIGFASVEFEGTAVYLHQDDYKHEITKNGVWLELEWERQRKFDRRYVLIEGTFDATHNGHRGLFNGTIRNIKRLELWP